MAATPETGFLVLADLTGYTAYLSGSEIEHAPAIAGDLLETIVGRLEPPFRLVKFEGDAAFLFVEDGRADGSLLLDAIEAAYLAFRRRLRSIDQATTCDCNSCRLAPRLDLKVFVHHGAFVWSRIAGRDELAGSDVIVAHRLLKGTGAAEARANGFALFTAAAVDALGLDADALQLRAGAEEIEHLGRVDTFTLDLEARWQDESTIRRLDIADTDLAFDIEATFAADPSVIWAHLTSPALRTRWEGPISHRGDVRRRAPRRRDDGSVRDRTAGDSRGDRRLATLRPRRVAAGRPGTGPSRGYGGSRADRGRDPPPTSLGIRGCRDRRCHGVPADAGGEGGRLRATCNGRLRRAAGRRAEGGSSMSSSVSEQMIERSAQDVWVYAADIVRHPDWMTVTDARIVRGEGTQVGARGRERLRFGPFGWDVEFEVAEAEPGRRIAWKSVNGAPFDLTVWLDLEPTGPGSTKASYGADIRLHGVWRLLSPMVAMEANAGPARELSRLKTQVEAAPAMTPAMS